MTYSEKLALAQGAIPLSKAFALIIVFLIWIFFIVLMADELRSALIFTGIVGCVILWCSCLTYSGVYTEDPANTVEHRERVSRYYSLSYYEYDSLEDMQNAEDTLNRAGKLLTARDSNYVFLGQIDGSTAVLTTDNGPMTIEEMLKDPYSADFTSGKYFTENVIPVINENMTQEQKIFDTTVRSLVWILPLGVLLFFLILVLNSV